MATVTYFHMNVKNINEKLRKSLIKGAVTFWDTVLWFGVLGCIASLVYATSKAKTLYEFVISLLVINLICNSMFLLLGLYSEKVKEMDESTRTFSRIPPQAFVFVCMYIVTMKLVGADSKHLWGTTLNWNLYNFIDMPCYAASVWPMYYLKIAVKLQLCLMTSPFAWALISRIFKYTPVIPYLGKTWLFGKLRKHVLLLEPDSLVPYPVLIFIAATLWVDFGFIVYVRAQGRADFGATFEDDAFGYGQIISAGIAAQVIYTYLCAVSGKPPQSHFCSQRQSD